MSMLWNRPEDVTNLKWPVCCAQILRAGLEDMTSSVQMFPSTMKVDLFVTAFGLLAPEGQLIGTGGHMHHSRSAMALLGMLNGILLSALHVFLTTCGPTRYHPNSCKNEACWDHNAVSAKALSFAQSLPPHD